MINYVNITHTFSLFQLFFRNFAYTKRIDMKNLFLLIVLSLIASVSLHAQKRKSVVRKPNATITVEDSKFNKMLSATAQIVIVDSTVIDSTRFLQVIRVNPEEGRVMPNSQFFHTSTKGFAYVNELGTKCIFSQFNDNGRMRLYQSDKVGGEWSEPEELKGIDDGNFTDLNYPYLMPDGVTLYFAARGAESLGGYDIYRTRLDAEDGRFLRPENIGLPFNSEADDYMYVVDEQRQLAYFATSRRQPRGKVCVYTFIPTETRKILEPEAYSPDELRSLARIDRIADTWGNGNERKKALTRLNETRTTNEILTSQATFSFIVNDQTTYTRMSDFRHAGNRSRMNDILSMQTQLDNLRTALLKTRNFYVSASKRERMQLQKEILESEQQELMLEQAIHQLEKEIRNTENQ